MIKEDTFYITIVLLVATFLVASIAIPCYGLYRKRLKGLALGCLIQPFVFGLFCILLAIGVRLYHNNEINKCRDAAMVTVRKTVVEGTDTILYTWYMKPDEECLYTVEVSGRKDVDNDDEDEDEDSEKSDNKKKEDINLFDVVTIDSNTLGIEDRVVVHLDVDSRTATATDFDEPIDVVNIDWEKVENYMNTHLPLP